MPLPFNPPPRSFPSPPPRLSEGTPQTVDATLRWLAPLPYYLVGNSPKGPVGGTSPIGGKRSAAECRRAVSMLCSWLPRPRRGDRRIHPLTALRRHKTLYTNVVEGVGVLRSSVHAG